MAHPQEKRKQIKAWKEEINLAKKDAANNKVAIDELVKESVAYANKAAKTFIGLVTIREDEVIAQAKQTYQDNQRGGKTRRNRDSSGVQRAQSKRAQAGT